MFSPEELETLNRAKAILASKLTDRPVFTSPGAVKDYCQVSLASREHEVFCALFLTAQHYLIEAVELFRGTINSASVYPREVVKEALARNAAAVVFAHNHPSGISEPSSADNWITERLTNALALIDIKVLDHIIVGHGESYSYAEHGLI